MNLLVFKVNQLGDNLTFLPVVQQWRRTRPQDALTVFTSPVAAALYGGPLAPHQVVSRERRDFNRSWRDPGTLFGLLRIVRVARPEAALLSFDQGSVAHLLARASGAPVRLGSADLRIRAPHGLTHTVGYRAGTKVADWNWEMGRTLNRLTGGPEWPANAPPPDLSHLVGGPVWRAPRTVAIHAGGSLAYRRWPVARFAALAARLARDCEVTWIDSPELGPNPDVPGVRRAVCRSLQDLARVLAATDLLAANHSGPVQVATALGCRGVVISGPSHPQWDPAWQPERWSVLRRPNLACLPCESPAGAPMLCLNRESPHACLDYWSVDAVEERCRSLLAAGEGRE